MSNDAYDKDSREYYITWLEKSIKDEHLNYYEYSEFENIRPLGRGSFGNVYRANWKKTNTILALKSFKNQSSALKEVVHELKLLRQVHFHTNILRFYGITKKTINQENSYVLVLEYADSGTLKTYLKEHFNELEWEDKFCLALQLADAVLCLHEHDIIHRDLHADNILVHQKSIKLTDFGLSKKIVETSSSKVFGVLPYVDPKRFNSEYKLDKKSDMYSVGVIMWQISSGHQPFENQEYDINLTLAICKGKRENIIDGTSIEYSDLYTKCWSFEPDERPSAQELVSTLKSIIFERYSGNTNEERNRLLEEGMNIADLSSNFGSGSGYMQPIHWFQLKAENGDKIAQYNLGRCYENGDGIEKDKVKAFEWYEISAEQECSDAQNSIGFFYENGVGTKKNLEKAIYWYQKAAENGNKTSQYNLGRCYENGNGIEKDEVKAFELYKKSAEQGDSNAQNSLGSCYKSGIGIEKDLEKSTYWYQKAAENRNDNVGKCDVEKNENKKSELTAEQENTKKTIVSLKKATENEYNLNSIGSLGETIKPFVPLMQIITVIIDECMQLNEEAQFNERICNALIDRIVTDLAIRTLQRRKHENRDKFQDKKFYKSFLRFVDVMKEIKSFIRDISQIPRFEKYINKTDLVKGKFHSLTKEFENVMNDLDLGMAIANENQKLIDQHSLNDIIQANEFLKEMTGSITEPEPIDVISQISKIGLTSEGRRDPTFGATTIEPGEIKDPLILKMTDRRGRKEPFIFKKSYKGLDVACVPREIHEDDIFQTYKIRAELAILRKLFYSSDILKFYGLSHIDNQMVMVMEWAELGDLREVYINYDIALPAKVKIARDICRGIIYLHTCSILHHDIRCARIMMTLRLEPKITGFEYARSEISSQSTDISVLTDIVHWLAPEKLRLAKNQLYNTKCEIFSFGMLLWELAFEKIPYEYWDLERIKDWVLSGKRESLVFDKDKPEIEELQEGYKQIIVAAWQDDPYIRATLQFLFLELNKLYYKTIGFDGTLRKKDPEIPLLDDGITDPVSALEIPPLDYGITAHKRKETTKAWEIFCEHANLGNLKAKYWKGFYLWEGYAGQKDRKHASMLFKEAADDGLADAQLRYAFSLVHNARDQGSKLDRKVFIEYLTRAADNQNSTAQFNLGDLYLNGKLGVPKNVELGKKYLRLAALSNQPKAIEILQKLGINVYD